MMMHNNAVYSRVIISGTCLMLYIALKLNQGCGRSYYTDSKRKRIVASVLLPLCFVAAQSA